MYGGLARGQGAYDMGGSAISRKAEAYRSDVDNIKGANKALVKQAEAATDLSALRDIGVEGAIKMFKPKIGDIANKLYNRSGLKDWDVKTTKKINDWRKANGLDNDDNEGRSGESGEINGQPSTSSETSGGQEPNNFVSEDSDPSSRGDIQVEPDDDASPEPTDAPPDPPSSSGQPQLEDAEPRAPNRMGDDPTNSTTYDDRGNIENFGDEGEEEGAGDNDFERFMTENTNTPMTESGDIDFDAPENNLSDMPRLAEQRRPRLMDGNEPNDGSPTEPGDQVTGNGDNMPTDDSGSGGGALEDATGDIGEDGISTALTTTAEGLETGGAALDATGVGAILGVPMEIAGGLVEAFGLIEAGKGIADWFDQDILGHHPKVNTTALPKAPVVNNANLAIPSFDSVQDAPTTAGGW